MRRILSIFLAAVLTASVFTACGSGENLSGSTPPTSEQPWSADADGAPAIDGLTFESRLELEYARCFSVFRYEGGYSLIQLVTGERFLVVPEDGEIPRTEDCVVLRKPIKNIYLVASAAMSLFCAADGLDNIRLVGTRQNDWYIDAAAQAMEEGKLLYAGKYSSPDYELLVSENCGLAVENTMIYHTPEVKEKLEELGIPVLVECSSNEPHPLGRTEWMKLYAVLTGKEDEAARAFQEQVDILHRLEGLENTGKTVAFFYVTPTGSVSTRKGGDYFAAMIELAGGKYVFENIGSEAGGNSSINMTMEDFYAGAKDADYIIYNSNIDDPVNSVEQLIAKDELFADFRAVQNGNVWCTGKYLYQATDILGSMTGDIHTMLTDPSATELSFMHKLF